MDLKGKKINFLGDSITEGVGASSRSKIYLNVMKEKEQLAEARNYGISGTRIARQAGYPNIWEYPAYVDRFSGMHDDADAVVVFGGTNDYGHGTAMLGKADDKRPDTFCGALNLLCEGLIKKYPTATIVFMTPLQRGESPNPSRCGIRANGADLIDYVNAIKERCRFYSIPVLDLYSVAGIHPSVGANCKTFCPDGLHPNDAGNAKIAEILASFLKQL